MDKVHIITYATHNFGSFDQLIKNKYNCPIVVLGWGEKWVHFRQKAKAYFEYVQKLSDDDIVVIIDGFDTIIKSDPKNIITKFKKMKTCVLLSKEQNRGMHHIGDYVVRKVFGTCKNNITANAGSYMGYAKCLKVLLKSILSQNENDDQIALNKSCKEFSFIKIDTNCEIFKNGTDNNRATFVQSNGGMDLSFHDYIKKYSRPGTWVYIKPFLFEVICFCVIMYIVTQKIYNHIKS